MADLRLHLAAMAAWPAHAAPRDWLESNASFRADVLALLGERGPLLSRDIPTRASSRGRRRAGRTTATSRRCSSS
jgi:hypothetical protein